jgi:hypothetical protein
MIKNIYTKEQLYILDLIVFNTMQNFLNFDTPHCMLHTDGIFRWLVQ